MNETVKIFDELIGKVFKVKIYDDEMFFSEGCNKGYKFYHSDSCCENVEIVDVDGDAEDLCGSPILTAEEYTNKGEEEKLESDGKVLLCESYTFTFYKFATEKGTVIVRWFGSSNGFYSEEVDFCKLKDSTC